MIRIVSLIAALIIPLNNAFTQNLGNPSWIEYTTEKGLLNFEYPAEYILDEAGIDTRNCVGSVGLRHAYTREYEVYDNPALGSEKIRINHEIFYEIILDSSHVEESFHWQGLRREGTEWYLESNSARQNEMKQIRMRDWVGYRGAATYSVSHGRERELCVVTREFADCKVHILAWLYATELPQKEYDRLIASLNLVRE